MLYTWCFQKRFSLYVSNLSPRLRTSLTWCGMWHRRHPAWASHRPRPRGRPHPRPRRCQWWKKSRWRKRQHLTFGQHLDATGIVFTNVHYIYIWLVVSNMNFIVHVILGCLPSQWRTHIFQMGGSTTNQTGLVAGYSSWKKNSDDPGTENPMAH